jgi:hypothetical protein
MTWRRVAVYYVLAAALGGYFLLFEYRPDSEKPILTSRPVQQSRFLPIPRDEIAEVTVRREEGSLTFRKNGQGWQVVDPPDAKITSALVTSLVESMTLEKEVQVVEQQPKDLAAYGLAPARSAIVLKGGPRNVTTTVFLGDRNPTGSAVYARKENAPEVVLLGYSTKYNEELLFEAAGFGKKSQ